MTDITIEKAEKPLSSILQNEPLIAIPEIHGGQVFPGTSIYYGTGLATARALATGLPFDVLGMILVAEKMRRTLRLNTIYHHIADTHALTNEFATPEAVEDRARAVETAMEKVISHLKLDNYVVLRASSFDTSDTYNECLVEARRTEKHGYVWRQLADMLYYSRHHEVGLKIGWLLQASETVGGNDERMFDGEYRELFGSTGLSFLYMKAGRTFDKGRQKVSPYIAISDEQRILLEASENVESRIAKAKELWQDKSFGGAMNHLGAIVKLYDAFAPEPSPRGPLPSRIQAIIDRVFME